MLIGNNCVLLLNNVTFVLLDSHVLPSSPDHEFVHWCLLSTLIRLNNEFMDDEGLRFRGIASDLMSGGVENPPSVYCITNGTKVTNLTEALLKFTVSFSRLSIKYAWRWKWKLYKMLVLHYRSMLLTLLYSLGAILPWERTTPSLWNRMKVLR